MSFLLECRALHNCTARSVDCLFNHYLCLEGANMTWGEECALSFEEGVVIFLDDKRMRTIPHVDILYSKGKCVF